MKSSPVRLFTLTVTLDCAHLLADRQFELVPPSKLVDLAKEPVTRLRMAKSLVTRFSPSPDQLLPIAFATQLLQEATVTVWGGVKLLRNSEVAYASLTGKQLAEDRRDATWIRVWATIIRACTLFD